MKRKRDIDGDVEEPDLKKRKLENEYFDEGDGTYKYGKSLLDPIWLLDEKECCIKLKKELTPYKFFQERENDYKERKKRLARLAAFLSYDELEFGENFTMYQNQLGWMAYEESALPYEKSLKKKFKKLTDSEKVKDIAYYMDEMYLFADTVKDMICYFLKEITGLEEEEEKFVGFGEEDEFSFPVKSK